MRHTCTTLARLLEAKAATEEGRRQIKPGSLVRARYPNNPAIVPKVPVYDVDTLNAIFFEDGHANVTIIPLAWLELQPVIQGGLDGR